MHELDEAEFTAFCEVAGTFWRNNTLGPAEPVILVEAMSQDLRVTLRNLTLANAVRRFIPARLVVMTGADQDWNDVVWSYFDADRIAALARAYGADDVINIHDLADRVRDGAHPEGFPVLDRTLAIGSERRICDTELERVVDATACRLLKVPRLDGADVDAARVEQIRQRSLAFVDVYEALVTGFETVALVTSHVDYNNFGLAVDAAVRCEVPVLFTQSTGSLKAYALFPEQLHGARTVRAELTRMIGDYFETYVWPRRGLLHRSAELTTWRAMGTLGRPSWWRKGGSSTIEIRTPQERADLRVHSLDRLGFPRDRPVVAVYNHAVSDALGTNVEVFADLADWFEQTADHASRHPEVSWLFIDHPQQWKYDASGFFDQVAARYEQHAHLQFVPSLSLSKNVMLSVVDLGITVRGSVSNELPSYGVPVIQAGWSEWSSCGVSAVARDRDHYWSLLDEHVRGLLAGDPVMDDEQRARARLWAWFYRSGSDVPSDLVQHWRVGQGDELFRVLRTNMMQLETDAEAAFVAVRRMWTRREPVLTRIDFTRTTEELAYDLGGVDKL